MTMPNDPVFEPGDEVVDYRGNKARVLTYLIVGNPGKSNRVTVEWHESADRSNPDKTDYYAGVFSHADR